MPTEAKLLAENMLKNTLTGDLKQKFSKKNRKNLQKQMTFRNRLLFQVPQNKQTLPTVDSFCSRLMG